LRRRKGGSGGSSGLLSSTSPLQKVGGGAALRLRQQEDVAVAVPAALGSTAASAAAAAAASAAAAAPAKPLPTPQSGTPWGLGGPRRGAGTGGTASAPPQVPPRPFLQLPAALRSLPRPRPFSGGGGALTVVIGGGGGAQAGSVGEALRRAAARARARCELVRLDAFLSAARARPDLARGCALALIITEGEFGALVDGWLACAGEGAAEGAIVSLFVLGGEAGRGGAADEAREWLAALGARALGARALGSAVSGGAGAAFARGAIEEQHWEKQRR
jgi:hypothetical protein